MFGRFVGSILKLEQSFFQNRVGNLFDRDIDKDIEYFHSMHPKDYFDRSIAQHKCQVYPFKKEIFRLNCLSFFLIPLAFVFLLINRKVRIEDNQSHIVCYYCFNIPGSLPEAMMDKNLKYLTGEECPYYLRFSDAPFLFRFFLSSFSHPFLSFRVMLKVARYRAIIDSFRHLEIIAVTGEFVDTSSAMTQYCHERGIQHYDFMQGEAFCSPRASFFHFDKCFVWDKHYEDMFISLGAYAEQFEVSMPQCLKKIISPVDKKTVDYTYYLGGDAVENMSVIRTAIDRLVAKGFVCEVRPHPRWSDIEEVEKIFQGITIQDTNTVSVEDSIVRTKSAVSLYSTVLLQAFHNDVNVVIDDLSFPDKYNMLDSYKYIMLNKPHQLLSQLITN